MIVPTGDSDPMAAQPKPGDKFTSFDLFFCSAKTRLLLRARIQQCGGLDPEFIPK